MNQRLSRRSVLSGAVVTSAVVAITKDKARAAPRTFKDIQPLRDQQGVLNKLAARVEWDDHPELNATPPFLSADGTALNLMGDGSAQLTISLLKTQDLAMKYHKLLGAKGIIAGEPGKCTVYPDAGNIGPFRLHSCNVVGFSFEANGKTPVVNIVINGRESRSLLETMVVGDIKWPSKSA